VAKPIGGDKERRARNLGEAIGALVTDLRKQKHWSQAELAHRVGCNESTVRILEMATKSPTLRTLENVAGAFSNGRRRPHHRRQTADSALNHWPTNICQPAYGLAGGSIRS
jgi:ribosome-binding protein aMBF1 (putative translation factor)